MSEFNNRRDNEFEGGDEVFSKVVRAGRRTYFFDVKATRANDYYLIVTESRKKQGRNGDPIFEKHKIFLYKDDFCKFVEGLEAAVDYIKTAKPEFFAEKGLEKVPVEQQSPNENDMLTVSEEEFDNL